MKAAHLLGTLLAAYAIAGLWAAGSPVSAASPDPVTTAIAAAVEDDRPEYHVMESKFCAECHPAIYAEHEQSTHGRAYTDDEVRLATARFTVKDCIICHTPRPIFETGVGQNPTRRHHGLEEGNTCMTCHWQPDYDYGAFHGGSECVDAFHPDVGTVDACASCHRNHGTPYQWEKAPTGHAAGNECIDCHMEEVERPVAVGGPIRAVRTHNFPGARSEDQVRKAYTYRATIEGNEAVVSIRNKGTGHNFPTELKQRAAVSLVIVKDENGVEVGRSRMVFRDPYKRPYGLQLPVNTQIPAGETREHRVPIRAANGTVETTMFFKLYYPIEDHHPDLSKVLESRIVPFSGLTPSTKEVISAPEVTAQTPEGIPVEATSPANLVDFNRPPIGTVDIPIPEGESPEDILALIELFQFPVPEGNRVGQNRLVEIGEPAIPALIEALGSWDNKTYNQAMKVLQRMGAKARPAITAGLDNEQLYVRLHTRKLIERLHWYDDEIGAALLRGLSSGYPLDRASAAKTLGLVRATDSVEAIRPLLGDYDPDVVREAAIALAELGDSESVDAMKAAFDEAYFDETKRDLAVCMARLGSGAGVSFLIEGLDHDDDLIRESFFESFFAVTGMHAGYDPLAPRKVRLASISDLAGWWAANSTADVLIPLSRDRDRFAEHHAKGLVDKLGGTDLGPTGSDQDRAMQEELIGMGGYAVPALVTGLKYPAGFASKRAQICTVLGQIGDPRATPALVATLRDPVISVAAWATWALEGQADPATIPALRRYEQRIRGLIATDTVPAAAGHGDALLAGVARAKMAAGDRSARRTLISLLLSDDLGARRSAIEGLERHMGETRGYDPEADEATRREMVQRWTQ